MKFLIYSFFLFLSLLVLFSGCEKSHTPQWVTHSIGCRNLEPSLDRPLIYRAYTPLHWIKKTSDLSESIADTTKSICEFFINENKDSLRITIHTFPFHTLKTRIPPQAQINRWKKQFKELDPLNYSISSEGHGGYSGLFFEGEGSVQGSQVKMMGWSMQLSPIYARQLIQSNEPSDQLKCADYTIKIIGTPHLLEQNKADLLAFARSFELIEELPFLP